MAVTPNGLAAYFMNGPQTPIVLLHADKAAWVDAILGDALTAIRFDLERKRRARILLSGGTTPADVYAALARVTLDWAAVELALVDERWLPPDDANSNGRLVRETLLVGPAAAAHFTPVLVAGRSCEHAVREANRTATPASVALLGMGADGHTASLFPGMAGLREALAAAQDYVCVDAGASAGAAPWPQRISLTPAGLGRARLRLLLVRGEQKRQLLLRALAGRDALEFPVRAALYLPGEPTRVHWCP